MKQHSLSLFATVFAASALAFSATAHAAADAEAAKAITKQNNCMKCHGIDKDRDGPSFKKTAAKYKGKADAEAKLMTHLTTGPKIKFEDGTEEEHKIVKTSPPKDEAQIKNLIAWILEQ